MANVDHIKRLQPDPDGLDFDGLRRRGVELLQQLSSDRWTDYNLHDPGVTLLESLCYGLTDLVYRTDFPVADFLTNQAGRIDYTRQALYPPQAIFPNRPVTDLDYCKLIYDRLPNVEDVWVHSHNESHRLRGLLSIFIKPHESLFKNSSTKIEQAHQDLRKDVFNLLSKNRNLCRDIDDIHIVRPQAFTLAGEIEIDDSRPSAEIYADIYFRCAKLISSGSQITRFEEALLHKMTWEEILTGPLTEHGYIDEKNFLQESYDIDVVKLISQIRQIPGVKKVQSLSLIDEQRKKHEHLKFDHDDAYCPVLHFIDTPDRILALRLQHSRGINVDLQSSEDDIGLILSAKSQREIQAFGEQVALHLKKHEFSHDAFRRNRGNIASVVSLPKGEKREFAHYLSIGENLPAIYGVNHYGIPKSEPEAVHARARQLKAYLFPFEQIMANYLSSLQHVRELYSLKPDLDRSYFSQFLTPEQIPNIAPLYTNRADDKEVASILRQQDQFEQRRNRVLDSLLALYGEQFPETELRRHDYYHCDQLDQHVLNCKILFLKHICELSSARGTARNLQKDWNHNRQSRLEKRIRILTGTYVEDAPTSLLSKLQDELQYVSNQRYYQRLQKQINFPNAIDRDKLNFVAQATDQAAIEEFKMPHGLVSDSILQYGSSWENYRIYGISEQHAWLCLLIKDEQVWPLCLLPRDEISNFLRNLIKKVGAISQSSEGLHLLEHILLRPHDNSKNEANRIAVEQDFYCHRVSIILPGFTVRFADVKTRLWIENLIAEQLPAHILPDFYWLEFAYLAQFEKRYEAWWEHMQKFSAESYLGDTKALDQCARDLIEFLNKNRDPQSNRYWI